MQMAQIVDCKVFWSEIDDDGDEYNNYHLWQTNVQIWKFANMQVCKLEDVQVCRRNSLTNDSGTNCWPRSILGNFVIRPCMHWSVPICPFCKGEALQCPPIAKTQIGTLRSFRHYIKDWTVFRPVQDQNCWNVLIRAHQTKPASVQKRPKYLEKFMVGLIYVLLHIQMFVLFMCWYVYKCWSFWKKIHFLLCCGFCREGMWALGPPWQKEWQNNGGKNPNFNCFGVSHVLF